jgi:hypothetical protein
MFETYKFSALSLNITSFISICLYLAVCIDLQREREREREKEREEKELMLQNVTSKECKWRVNKNAL